MKPGRESACVSKPMNSGPVDVLVLAVQTDGLRDREDVRFVKGPVERRAAMAGGAERDALLRIPASGLSVVRGHQLGTSISMDAVAGFPAKLCKAISAHLPFPLTRPRGRTPSGWYFRPHSGES